MAEPAPRDPGAAFERTLLAWHRTGLSAAGAGALAFRIFFDRLPLGVVLSALLLLVGAAAWIPAAPAPTAPWRLRGMAIGITASAVLAGFLSMTGT